MRVPRAHVNNTALQMDQAPPSLREVTQEVEGGNTGSPEALLGSSRPRGTHSCHQPPGYSDSISWLCGVWELA